MSLLDDIVQLADDRPELVGDLLPILELATGVSSCCRKPRPASDRVVRARLIRLANAREDLRPHLLPIIPRVCPPR